MTTLLNAVVEAITPKLYDRMDEETIQYVARMAIKAAFQHASVHITDSMLEASRSAGLPDLYLPTDDADKFRAMLAALLAELDGETKG